MTQIEPSRQRTAVLLSPDAARDIFTTGVSLTVDQRIGLGNVIAQAQANAVAEERLKWERGAARRHNRTLITVAMITLVGALGAAWIGASAYYASHRTTTASARLPKATGTSKSASHQPPRSPITTRRRAALASGATLTPGQSLVSPNRLYRLTLQTDGNVVEYGPYGAVWDFYSAGVLSGISRLVMQKDCNLVGYGPEITVSMQTQGRGLNCVLRMQDDGNAVVVADGNYPIWNSFDDIP